MAKRNLDQIIADLEKSKRRMTKIDKLDPQDKADVDELLSRGVVAPDVAKLIYQWTGVEISDSSVRTYIKARGLRNGKKAK